MCVPGGLMKDVHIWSSKYVPTPGIPVFLFSSFSDDDNCALPWSRRHTAGFYHSWFSLQNSQVIDEAVDHHSFGHSLLLESRWNELVPRWRRRPFSQWTAELETTSQVWLLFHHFSHYLVIYKAVFTFVRWLTSSALGSQLIRHCKSSGCKKSPWIWTIST